MNLYGNDLETTKINLRSTCSKLLTRNEVNIWRSY